jgi:hypothetical protein
MNAATANSGMKMTHLQYTNASNNAHRNATPLATKPCQAFC